MKVLKSIAVSVLGFFLFLALSVFGIAFSLESTVLNPDFITKEINSLDVSALVRDSLVIEPSSETESEVADMVFNALDDLEPVVKERLDDTIHAVYEYFPGDSNSIDLALILRQHFFTDELAGDIIDKVDVAGLAGMMIEQQVTSQIPAGVDIENLDQIVEQAVKDAEPDIRTQLDAVSGPIFDYLLGQSRTLHETIYVGNIKETILQSILSSLTPDMQAAYQAFGDTVADTIPSEIVIDETMIDPEVPQNIDRVLTQTESIMAEAGIYINWFHTGYILLMVLIGLLVLGIVLILRDVRAITRTIGVPLIVYGGLEYAGVWATKYLVGSRMQLPQQVPDYVNSWLVQFTYDSIWPVEIFSLVLLVLGIVLTVVSYVYKRGEYAD